LLKFHGEYGGKRAAQIADSNGPSNLRKTPIDTWISEVLELLDPESLKQLHGRLLHLMDLHYVSANKMADKNVVNFLIATCELKVEKAVVLEMRLELKEPVCNEKLVAQEFTFTEFHEKHLHLMSSFSFFQGCDPLRKAVHEKNVSAEDVQIPVPEETEDS